MSTTIQGSNSAVTIGKEVATLLAREIAQALPPTPSFAGGTASEGFALSIGNDTLSSAVHVTLSATEAASPSVTSALSKEIYNFLKADPIASAVFADVAKTGVQLSLTRDPTALQGSGASVTLPDATKITFHSIEQLSPKHFG